MNANLPCPDLQKLQAFVLGTLSAQESLKLKSHLKQCTGCRAVFQSLSSNPDTLQTATYMPGKKILLSPTERETADTQVRGEGEQNDSHFSFLQPAVESDELGRLGNYRVLRFLKKGGMGYVFYAEDVALRRPVALKVMSPDLKGDADGWPRFIREARAMAAIKHKHLVTIYYAGQEGDVVYFAMELLEGETLESWMERVKRPAVAEILRIGREIASGLEVLHGRNLVHRDIKPANLWLESPDRHVKILDLGLTRQVQHEGNLTTAGTILGTPGYMSPEQARGDTVDARSDLFSLGCVLYALCTGKRPFRGDTLMAELTALAVKRPQPLRELNPQIPEALADLINQMLAKRVQKRPNSAAAVREQLERIAEGSGAPTPVEDLSPTSFIPRETRKRRVAPKTGTFSDDRTKWFVASVLAAFGLLAIVGAVVAIIVVSSRSPDTAGADKNAVAVPNPGAGKEVVFLTDLPRFGQQHWPSGIPAKLEPGEKGPKDKGPKDKGPKDKGAKGKGQSVEVSINGKISPHGIFMHPPPPPFDGEPVSISYALERKYRRFTAEVSINDGPDVSDTPCTFRVFGDGKMLWESKPVTSQADTQKCTIAVEGVDVLRIEVVCPGKTRGAHAVWVEPQVAK
jgi:serine/threonine protein kinase